MISKELKFAFAEMMVVTKIAPRKQVREMAEFLLKETADVEDEGDFLKLVLDKADQLELTDGEFLGAFFHYVIKGAEHISKLS